MTNFSLAHQMDAPEQAKIEREDFLSKLIGGGLDFIGQSSS